MTEGEKPIRRIERIVSEWRQHVRTATQHRDCLLLTTENGVLLGVLAVRQYDSIRSIRQIVVTKKGPGKCRGLEGGADHALRNLCYVGCLWTLLTLDDFELDSIAFGERLEAAA